jgi:hypothetical protein
MHRKFNFFTQIMQLKMADAYAEIKNFFFVLIQHTKLLS